jgi:hypothetical protein
MRWLAPLGSWTSGTSGCCDGQSLVVEPSLAGCRQPALLEAVERQLARQCADLDPGEAPPTQAATRAWQRALWRLLACQADAPVPACSILGNGAMDLEWGRGTRSAFLIVEASGSSRLRRLDVAEPEAKMSAPIPDPQSRDLMDAIGWATGR